MAPSKNFIGQNKPWMSVSNKLFKTPQHSLKWIILEGYGVGCSGLENSFLLFTLKNPRSRSRWVCSYFMKKSRFFDNLFALQRLLLYDQFFIVKYWDLSEKIPYGAKSTTWAKIGAWGTRSDWIPKVFDYLALIFLSYELPPNPFRPWSIPFNPP